MLLRPFFLAFVVVVVGTLHPASANLLGLLDDIARTGAKSVDEIDNQTLPAIAREGHHTPLTDALAALKDAPAGAVHLKVSSSIATLTTAKGTAVSAPFGASAAPLDDWNGLNHLLDGVSPQGGVVVLEGSTVQNLGQAFDELAAARPVRVTVNGFPLRNVVKEGDAYFAELQPGLLLPLTDLNLSDASVAFLKQEISPADVRVVPAFAADEFAINRQVHEISGENTVEWRSALERLASDDAFGQKTLIFVGHIEGDGFAIRNASGELEASIAIREIEDRVIEKGGVALFLGCGSYACTMRSGLLDDIQSDAAIASLQAALKSTSVEDMIARLGSPENPYAITEAAVEKAAEGARLRIERLRQGRTGRGVGRAAGAVLRSAVESSPAFNVVRTASFFYGGGLLLVLTAYFLNITSLWDRFRLHYPVLPSKEVDAVRFSFLWSLRLFVYLLTGPVVLLVWLVYVAFCLGNFSVHWWTNAGPQLGAIWLCMLRPWHAAYKLFVFTSICAGCVAIVCLPFGIAMAAGSLVPAAATRGQADMLFVLAGLGGSAMAGVWLWKNEERLLARTCGALGKVAVALAGQRGATAARIYGALVALPGALLISMCGLAALL